VAGGTIDRRREWFLQKRCGESRRVRIRRGKIRETDIAGEKFSGDLDRKKDYQEGKPSVTGAIRAKSEKRKREK